MKVSKAKTKVCPFMSDNTIGRDVYGKYNAVSYCICGDCMAWVYTIEYEYSLNEELKEDDKEGYCKRLER